LEAEKVTQMSKVPGRRHSGKRTAYVRPPRRYRAAMNGNQAGTLMTDRMLSIITECVAGMIEPNPSMANNTEHTHTDANIRYL